MQFFSVPPKSLVTIARKAGVLCLFALPVVCWAQADGLPATSSEDAAADSSGNAATASLERALAHAVTVKFAPLGIVADDDLESEPGAFFTDEILLAQVELPQMIAQNQGNAQPPKPNPAEPNLGDLGFPNAQTQGSAQDQARLDKRSHMLKIHQRLGLITTVPLAATLLTSGLAGGHSTSSTGRDLHATLGTITAGMYITTAYYAIFAPRIAGTKTRGPIRLHKALAFIHGPGMILTPILGAMAFDQKNAGEKVHGIASAHGAVAAITGIAYGLAIVSVSVHF